MLLRAQLIEHLGFVPGVEGLPNIPVTTELLVASRPAPSYSAPHRAPFTAPYVHTLPAEQSEGFTLLEALLVPGV